MQMLAPKSFRRALSMKVVASLLTLVLIPALLHGADKARNPAQPLRAKRFAWKPQGELDQNFPFVSACIGAKDFGTNKAYKGIAIKLENDAYACFDTDLLRMYAGWTGEYLNFIGVTFSGSHGDHPSIAGNIKFSTKLLPGVADEAGEFKDARKEMFGPISEEVARWNGLYVQGDHVVLSYTAGANNILELPSSVAADGQIGFARDFKIEKVKQPFSIALCDVDGATSKTDKRSQEITLEKGDAVTSIALIGAPRSVTLENINGSRVVLKAAKGTSASTFRVLIWSGPKNKEASFAVMQKEPLLPINITQAGPARWPETVTTKGVLAFDKTPDGAYVVDQLTPPTENPWNRRVRFGGMDFFADGKRAALSTWDGDVWIVSGIDDKLENLVWKRFASGGYETLGLKIVNDIIYTSGRNQITRYHDVDGDGEADFYENFNNQMTSSDGFHEFVFDLHTDKAGNFYMAKAGPVRGGGRGFGGDNFGSISAHAGTMLKVSPDGKKLEVVATGFRAPNGMCVGPNGELTTGDNEGTWVPACPINWVEPGGFYGVETLAHTTEIPEYHQPLCWMSHQEMDNSGGGQAWVTSDKWGPFESDLLHLSYGKCTLYLVLKEKLYGQWQGGVVKFPLKFTSSTMRARFNSADGQLYICGLQGWQTTAAKLAGFDRVRYTGKKVYSVCDLQIRKKQVRLTFTQPLDPEYANDAGSFSIKRWNYHRTADYGSGEFSVADPKKQGRDDVEIQKAWLSPDGKTVNLEIADLQPVMQQSISFDLKAKDGTAIKQYIQHTINVMP